MNAAQEKAIKKIESKLNTDIREVVGKEVMHDDGKIVGISIKTNFIKAPKALSLKSAVYMIGVKGGIQKLS